MKFSHWRREEKAESEEEHARKLASLKTRLRDFVINELPWANVSSQRGSRIVEERAGLTENTKAGEVFTRDEAIQELLERMGITGEHVRRYGNTLAENVGKERKIPFEGKILRITQKAIREAVAQMLREKIPEQRGELHEANPWGGNHWAKAVLEAGSLIKQQKEKKKKTQEQWKYRRY